MAIEQTDADRRAFEARMQQLERVGMGLEADAVRRHHGYPAEGKDVYLEALETFRAAFADRQSRTGVQ